MVAMWFAALFGLGSLVLPTALPEHIITLTGADALIPAMAPPLGFKAHVLIALAATVVGGIGGLALARRIVTAQSRGRQFEPGTRLRNADRHPDAPARRPISALEELGEDRLPEFREQLAGEFGIDLEDEPAEKLGRRRTFANLGQSAFGGAQAPTYSDVAPLPVEDEAGSAELDASEEFAEIPLDTQDVTGDIPTETHEYGSLGEAAGEEASADHGFSGIAEEQAEQPEAADVPPGFLAPENTAAEIQTGEDALAGVEVDPAIREASLDDLGVTDLVQRLAHAIQIRQEPPVAVSSAILASKALVQQWPVGFDQAPASGESGDGDTGPQAIPAALRPYSFDEEDGEGGIETDLALSDLGLHEGSPSEYRVLPGFGDMPAYQAEDFANESNADDEDDSALAEDSYSSLLNLNMGTARAAQLEDFEELEETESSETLAPEDAVADENISGETEDADKALREVLARLQRMGRG